MKLSDFDFDLPLELISQHPPKKRDHSDLLLPPGENNFKKTKFFRILDYLFPGDLLIFNDSKVINAQLTLFKGQKKINVNLNKPIAEGIWSGFARPARKIEVGDGFHFDNHKILIDRKLENGEVHFKFELIEITVFEFLETYGQVPLPSYIKRQGVSARDKIRYQNIYSNVEGSVAAPTAGLHFTKELLQAIGAKGIDMCFVTLHVGAGTFLPVKTDDITQHKMHSEYCHIDLETAELINKAKNEGRRVIMVGTTALRAVESCSSEGKVTAGIRETDIFITPGYRFQIADMLLTNFHLPKSTLFMLVCAFSGIKEMKTTYKYAIDNKMRFFSYGDAMLLTRKDN